MDYALAKSLCSIGVKPASFRSIMQQDGVSLYSKGLNTNVQSSKSSLGKSINYFVCHDHVRNFLSDLQGLQKCEGFAVCLSSFTLI